MLSAEPLRQNSELDGKMRSMRWNSKPIAAQWAPSLSVGRQERR